MTTTEADGAEPSVAVKALMAQRRALRERITSLEAENERLRVALEEIAGKGCGISGHTVAVGCGSPEAARRALNSQDNP